MSSDVLQFRNRPPGLSREDAEKWIRGAALDSKNLGTTAHAIGRMLERDISMRLVWEVVKSGRVVKDPKWDDEHGDWTCEVQRRVSGRNVTAVIALENKNKMTVVTTYG